MGKLMFAAVLIVGGLLVGRLLVSTAAQVRDVTQSRLPLVGIGRAVQVAGVLLGLLIVVLSSFHAVAHRDAHPAAVPGKVGRSPTSVRHRQRRPPPDAASDTRTLCRELRPASSPNPYKVGARQRHETRSAYHP